METNKKSQYCDPCIQSSRYDHKMCRILREKIHIKNLQIILVEDCSGGSDDKCM